MLKQTFEESCAAPEVAGAHLTELKTKGFVVVRSFLSSDEVEVFARDYEAAERGAFVNGVDRHAATRRDDAIDVPYKVRHVTLAAKERIQSKLDAMLAMVEQTTGIRADTHSPGVFGSVYFATEGDLGLAWHQDHISYYACQNHYDYLNFYIPVVKPDRAKSNLCVVPFDVLAVRSPEMCEQLRGRGASRCVTKPGKTIVYDHDLGGKRGVLPFELDEIAVTPELDAGDLLLLRGDVVHRTQDTDTRRLAVSIRMMNGSTKVDRKALLRGGLIKTVLMAQGRGEFKRLLNCFDIARRDELTIGEIANVQASARLRPERLSTLRFLRYLMINRLAMQFGSLA